MTPLASAGNVFIVDDDVSYLRSVSRLLTATGHTVRTFDSGTAFLSQLAPDMIGCVLVDLKMPGLNGLELQAALARSVNPLPVVFLSAQGDIPATVQAMRAGAEDFLTKLTPKEKLLEAIQRALARAAQERAGRRRRQELQQLFSQLTQRECEVLVQVVRGQMNKEIADDLAIHIRTVKLHRTNLTRKLKVQSVAELTRLYEEFSQL